jgi:outer membrane receptor for ferrienterochelin and colicin
MILPLLVLAAPALAQNAATTGQIRGRVTSSEGAEIASVSIVARNTQTGLERSALSGRGGVYAIHLLPPGTYNVRATMVGYAEREQPAVVVQIGQAATVNFQLSVQAVELGAIEVSAERPPINVAAAAVVQNVTRAEIENLPVLGRDFVDFINLSGMVSPDPGETTGGQFSIGGQRASQTSIQIDGVDANNAFFGENRGGSRIPFVFSLESIQEFNVVANGFDVEYGNYSGGIVNVVTRGGTNDLRGSAYVNYRGDALTGKGFLDTVKVADYQVTQYAGSISGPIKRDEAFFLFSIDGQRRREPQIPLQLADYAPGGARADSATYADVQRFWTALENVYGISDAAAGYRPFQTTNDAITLFGRVDWNLDDQHRLSVRHNFSTFSNDNEFDDNFDFLYGLSRAEKIESLSNSFVTELQSVFGPNTFNVFRFQFSNEDRPRQGSNIRPALVARLSNGDQIGYGGTFVGFNNDLEERKLQFVNNLTHIRGQHTLKVGVNGIFTRDFNSFLPYVGGTCRGSQGAGIFCFNNIADFEAGDPASYQFNVHQGESMVPTSEFDVRELGFYVQDEWRALPDLTVTVGLRHDRQAFGEAPGRILDVERAFGFKTDVAPSDNNNISPRLSLAYDLGEGLGVVRAGAGYFFGRVPYVLGGNVLGSQRPVYNLTCAGSEEDEDPSAPPSPTAYPNWSPSGTDNPISCAGGAAFSGVPTYTIWGSDFEYPETFKANVGGERLIGHRAQFSADLLYSRSTNLYTVRNLNLREPQFTLENEGGRQVFTPAGLFTPGSTSTLGSRLYSNLGPVFVNYTDGRAESWVANLEGSYRLFGNTTLRASYTFTRAYDNSSYSCCTGTEGFEESEVGAFGPNDLGGFGDRDKAWGPSYFSRDHTFVLSGFTTLPYDVNFGLMWRIQSGRPFTPEVSGDINGDGVSFNDRPFIFAPEDLPLAATLTAEQQQAARDEYATLLAENDCIGDYVGRIIPRGTCRTPWVNQLDMRVSKVFDTFSGQRAELQVDLFNVLNGVGRLWCDESEMREALAAGDDMPGTCGWGRVTTVSGASRNAFSTSGFTNGQITYTPFTSFGRESVVGSNLQLQFQAQVGLRYYF